MQISRFHLFPFSYSPIFGISANTIPLFPPLFPVSYDYLYFAATTFCTFFGFGPEKGLTCGHVVV